MTKNWATQSEQELLDLVQEHYKDDQDNKIELARIWEENIRFIDGDQYIRYNKSAHAYEPIPDRIDKEHIPRANDNQLFVRADILRSNLTKQQGYFNLSSASKDPIDERIAKVALSVHDARTEIDMDKHYNADAADWAVATGNAFTRTAWVPSKKIPLIGENGETELDKDGNPMEAMLGDVERRTVSPFKMAPSAGATSIFDAEAIMEHSVELTSDVKSWYSVNGKGFTGKAANLNDEDIESDSLLKIIDDLNDYNSLSKNKKYSKHVILKTVFVKPTDELPFGRHIVVANGLILFDSDSQYAKYDRFQWHPYNHFRYRKKAGAFWGVTPITQCVRLQRRLNAIDTIMILHRQTMALGQWLIPKGTLPNSGLSGRVGLKIEYKVLSHQKEPKKIDGTSLGQDLWEERQMIPSSMDQICGTTDVMKGGQPGSIESGISLELIREMSFSRFNPMYEDWEQFLEKSSQLRLNLIANNQNYDLPYFTRMLQKKLKNLTGIDISTFTGQTIKENTNIRIEAGSTIPKSQTAKKAHLQKFGEAGLLGDLVEDPFKNQVFLQEFGIDNFKTETNVEWEKAKFNLAVIEQGHPVKAHPEDDHVLHARYLKSKLQDPEWFTSRPPQVSQAGWALYQEHQKMIQDAQTSAQDQERRARDENAYVQSVVNSGGPDGDPPSLELFPTVIEDKVKQIRQSEQMQNNFGPLFRQ